MKVLKRIISVAAWLVSASCFAATTYTETVDGITWTYTVVDGGASVGGGSPSSTAVPKSTSGSIAIPSRLGGYSVTGIGSYAFYNCSGLTSVTIPDGVKSIGDRAFHSCSGLTSVMIPDGVTSIGNYAFRNCSGLTSVTIPDGVKSIGDRAFHSCSGLMSISVAVANANYESINGLLLSKGGKTLIQGVNRDVTIPDSVTSIGNYAFYNCSGLTSVTVPNGVVSIGDSAFESCSGLTSVTIPDSVTSIGSFAFSGCSGLMEISVGVENDKYSSASGLLLSKDGTTLIQGVNGYVMIPDGVTNIGNYAFYGCSGLTSVTIPDSVTRIGNYAFYKCSGLTNVTIGDSVTSIGFYAFESCSGLTSVTIPDSVTSIGRLAFNGTPFYNNQPNGLVIFGKVAYRMKGDCPSSVIIPPGVVSIGDDAFERCSGLTSITIPDGVTSIGSYAFYNCSGLASVKFCGDEPMIVGSVFAFASSYCVAYVPYGAIGFEVDETGMWNGLVVEYYMPPLKIFNVTRYPSNANIKAIAGFALTPKTDDGWEENFKLTGTQTLQPDGFWMNKSFVHQGQDAERVVRRAGNVGFRKLGSYEPDEFRAPDGGRRQGVRDV